MFASTPKAYCRSLSRGGAMLYASELQKINSPDVSLSRTPSTTPSSCQRSCDHASANAAASLRLCVYLCQLFQVNDPISTVCWCRWHVRYRLRSRESNMTDQRLVRGLQDATVDHRDIAPVRHPSGVNVAPIQWHLPNYHHTVLGMWWSNQNEVRIGCHSETALQTWPASCW